VINLRSTVMEVDIAKFNNNIDVIQKYVGEKTIMPVIKANAYGTYVNRNLDVINRFDIVAVALVDEAIELRNLGYKKEIFVLNQPSIDEIENIIKYDITIGLSSFEFLNSVNNPIKVHLEIETGMNRTGIQINNLDKFINEVKKNNNIVVEGIYTHFSSADYDYDYTNKQIELFNSAVSFIKDNFNNIKYIHSSASNGLLNFNDGSSNLVRAGIIMYGYYPFNEAKDMIKIEPISKLKTKITYIKDVDPLESISYGRKFITDKRMKIATIPIGYADGLRRVLLNKGNVVINGIKCPIIGTICMDSCMIDVTNIKDVSLGSDVYIWDNDIITLEEIADSCNTINYEIMSTISDRVPRIFKEG